MTDETDAEAPTDPYIEGIRSSCCGADVDMLTSGNAAATSRMYCNACGEACGPVFVEDADG